MKRTYLQALEIKSKTSHVVALSRPISEELYSQTGLNGRDKRDRHSYYWTLTTVLLPSPPCPKIRPMRMMNPILVFLEIRQQRSHRKSLQDELYHVVVQPFHHHRIKQ
ncbi:hypothetical protein F2Q68_00006943 [Brassica cretica]|uniref:Uncharacterized protein n=1 Tax=Brassica cretica TaxID=69181 RepID=A0A8S9JLT1_BRACR|nr:hypothetical protein F2Q68_00006943 [Brassica cretica]